ncbi:MAG: hypothetical protein R3F50_05445 [Gammaproteobacteria bacterium]|jgi:hypothetical protein
MSDDSGFERWGWKNESSWLGIATLSGLSMALLFGYFDRFPGASPVVVALICCAGFYILSILLRLQNHRGEFWLGKTVISEGRLKVIFPLLGFAFGLALLVL